MRRLSGRAVAAGLFVVALLVAGILSLVASSQPDGLERVAEDAGISQSAEEHAVADGPLADYQTRGVEDERLSGGLAGVIGVVAAAAAASGLFLLLRRRDADEAAEPHPTLTG